MPTDDLKAENDADFCRALVEHCYKMAAENYFAGPHSAEDWVSRAQRWKRRAMILDSTR